MMQVIGIAILSLLFAESVAVAAEATIPAPFHGKWRAADGTCETAPSTGVLIDAKEVMFGETGYFVDRIVRANETEAEIFVSQPHHDRLRVILHAFLKLTSRGRSLTIAVEDRIFDYQRCSGQRDAEPGR